MAFKVKKKYSLAGNLHHLLLKQMSKAVRVLSDPEIDHKEAVHEARIAFKKCRSILQLVKYQIGQQKFDTYNSHFRDLALRLAKQRDAVVKAEALQKIADKAEKPASKTQVEEYGASNRDPETTRKIIKSLGQLRSEVEGWQFERHGFSILRKPLKRIYKRGAQAMEQAYASRRDSDFHKWRKRAKNLLYTISLLRPIKPKLYNTLKDDLSVMAEALGDDHDLTILKRDLRARDISENKKSSMLEQIEADQKRLRDKAFELGKRIYSRPANKFAARLEQDWKAWRGNS